MFLVWGPDRFFFYNDAYTSMLQPGVTGVIGSSMAELRAGESGQVHMAVESAFAGQTSRLTDVAVVSTRDGRHERDWWTVSYSPIFDETGSVAGVLSFSIKATACVADADRLRESEVRDHQIIDSITETAIIATDINGRVTRWNEGARRLLGWSETEMSGELIHRCFTPEDVARGVADLEMQRAFRDGSFPDNRWHQRKDGSRFWGNGKMTVLRDSGGKAAGFVKVFRDRTRQWAEEEALHSTQRQADLALRQAEEQLRHLQKIEAVGRLTGGVAHDFNNLLTVICSSVDFLKRPDATEAQRFRCITAIADAAERGAKLTGQLLAFARRQDLKHEVFAVGDNIRKLQEMLGTLIGAGIEIVTNDLEVPCFVSADPNQFDTALVNGRQRPRRYEWRGTAHVPNMFGRQRAARSRERESVGRVCGGFCDRYRCRHLARRPRADLRAVLHHQGDRVGHRIGVVPGVRLCQTIERRSGGAKPGW